MSVRQRFTRASNWVRAIGYHSTLFLSEPMSWLPCPWGLVRYEEQGRGFSASPCSQLDIPLNNWCAKFHPASHHRCVANGHLQNALIVLLKAVYYQSRAFTM
jgi:hypothetical protein